jgi:hypothetical protein
MRAAGLLACVLAAGCASQPDPAPLTGDRGVDGVLARKSVARVEVRSVGVARPGAQAKLRANVAVATESKGGDRSGGVQQVSIGVIDPEAGKLKEPESDGNLLVPAGGVILALCGTGGGLLYTLVDRGDEDGEIPIGGEDGTPVSTPTNRPVDPAQTKVTVETPAGTVDCETLGALDDAVLARAPLTSAHAGPCTVTATQNGQVVGQWKGVAVFNEVRFVPGPQIDKGQKSNLIGTFLPADRNIEVTIATNAREVSKCGAECQIAGSPGAFVLTFRGPAQTLTGVPLFTVTGIDVPIQASAEVRELK